MFREDPGAETDVRSAAAAHSFMFSFKMKMGDNPNTRKQVIICGTVKIILGRTHESIFIEHDATNIKQIK